MTSSSDSPRPGLTIAVHGEDLDQQGRGIARWNGWVITVPELLPGELASVQLLQRQRRQWHGKKIQSIEPSADARRPPCILAHACGGCTLQHLSVEAQNRWKQDHLHATLHRIGGLTDLAAPLVSPEAQSLGYRNRALIPLQRLEGELRLGYYRRGSHRIVNLNHCPVLDPRLDALIEPIKRDLSDTNWPIDSDLRGKPGLRHLGLRIGVRTGELLISLVSATEHLPGLEQLAGQWMQRWPALKGVTLNVQPKRSNTVLGAQTLCLQGQDVIEEYFCGLTLQLGTTTFFQVNTERAEQVVTLIRDWIVSVAPSANVIDAYCGIGTIALPLAAAGLNVIGLEINRASVIQAQENARRNALRTATFLDGDVVDHLRQLLPIHQVLVVDPPRKGLAPDVLQMILAIPPAFLIYQSCDPATLARDLQQLAGPDGPYRIETIRPVDFFPQTSHLECLVMMVRVSSEVRPRTA